MPNKGLTLLIAEDNHDLRNGLKDILTFEGFTVLAAGNGKEWPDQLKAVWLGPDHLRHHHARNGWLRVL
jgi:DNA-binding response OmpR family regulator